MRNVDVGKDNLADGKLNDISYQTFSNMASFYGRFMDPHRHDGYFQIHYIDHGYINLSLDDSLNLTPKVPLFILTPPSIPHAFFTTNNTTGHVLTVRESLINPLIESMYPTDPRVVHAKAICVSLSDNEQARRNLDHIFSIISSVAQKDDNGNVNTSVLGYMIQALFSYIFSISDFKNTAKGQVKGELGIFQDFNRLIEENFTKQLSVPEYAAMLEITESRLKDMCRRFSALPPKRMIFERLLLEAKRQLIYTDNSINKIALNLGFNDPSYFARFFMRHVGVSPSRWRSDSKSQQIWS